MAVGPSCCIEAIGFAGFHFCHLGRAAVSHAGGIKGRGERIGRERRARAEEILTLGQGIIDWEVGQEKTRERSKSKMKRSQQDRREERSTLHNWNTQHYESTKNTIKIYLTDLSL